VPKPKIDKVKLSQLLRAGKSQKEIAQVFGVTEGAISKAKKELNISVVKNVGLESAHRVVDKHLNTIAQLQKINSNANELLDLLMAWNRGDDTALQILESQVRKVKRGTRKEPEEVEEYRFKDPRELALRAMAEIRGQLSLQLDMFKTLYDVEAIAEFQREVLEAIGEVSPDVRNRIVQRLKEGGALRPSATIDRSTVSLV
jgi:transcriptional regulator with XRE-family HTH domain